MNIYVLDTSFQVVAVLDNYSSVIWTTRFYTYGDFELCVPASEKMLNTLKAGRYLVRDFDMVGNVYSHVMTIYDRHIQTDAENGDTLIVTGKDQKAILERRVISSQTVLNGTVAACVEALLNVTIIEPTDTDRAIPHFLFNHITPSGQLAQQMKKQVTGKNLAEAVAEICETYGVGYDVTIDNGYWIFSIFEGTDRSYDQSVFPYVVFSAGFDNLLSCNYTESLENYANVCYVAGEGEGTARKIAKVGGVAGLYRFECWEDARNASTNGGTITDETYMEQLAEDGAAVLSEREKTVTMDGELSQDGSFMLNRDYYLGDVVQVDAGYGITAKTRVIEVIESEDATGVQIIPTFSEMEVN